MEVIVSPKEGKEFVLLVLVEMLLFALAFTRKCHTEHSGIRGHSQGRAPGCGNQDEHGQNIQ